MTHLPDTGFCGAFTINTHCRFVKWFERIWCHGCAKSVREGERERIREISEEEMAAEQTLTQISFIFSPEWHSTLTEADLPAFVFWLNPNLFLHLCDETGFVIGLLLNWGLTAELHITEGSWPVAKHMMSSQTIRSLNHKSGATSEHIQVWMSYESWVGETDSKPQHGFV